MKSTFSLAPIRFGIAVILITCMMVAGIGCQHRVNSNNPKVIFAATLLSAADASDTLATGLVAADQVLDNLRATEPEYYAHTKPILVKIAKANDKAIVAIRAAKNGDTTANWQGALIAVLDAAGKSDLTAFGFKNPNSQAAARIGFSSLQLAVAAIRDSFSNQPLPK